VIQGDCKLAISFKVKLNKIKIGFRLNGSASVTLTDAEPFDLNVMLDLF
jgi:hypothetical protein